MKNSVKQILSLMLSLTLVLAITSCGDDDNPSTPNAPTLSTPDVVSVVTEESVEITFEFNAPGGINTATVTNTIGGSAAVGPLTSGETSGSFLVTFTANNAAGVGSVTVSLSDNSGQTTTSTATIAITDFPTVFVRGNIEENTTWTADNIYILDTRVTVISGVTLTIEPGTVIKGNEGQEAAATALLVARGGMLMAEGTAQLPIIFTSIFDPIRPTDIANGEYSSTTEPTQPGLWGGVIVLGNAGISAQNDNGDDVTELQIEGIPSSDPNGLYGGNDDADNSGVISYISIRHGGTNIGSGNEINGLTLGGVGSGTTINNVEVVANADDGIEFFGGTVSVDNALIWNSYDDSMDTDQDWVGTVTDFIIVTPRTGSAFELDGPEGTTSRGLQNRFTGGVVFGGADIDHIVDWDDDTNTEIQNTYFFGLEAGNIETFGGDGNGTNSGWETDEAAIDPYFTGVPAGVITLGVAVGSKTVGPTAADFAWTWAGHSGALTGLGL
jgi:hypothetical protein